MPFTRLPFIVALVKFALITFFFKPCRWAPDIPCILYHGSKQERADLRAKHMPHKVDLDFPVIVTSYEIVIRDMPFLRRWQWKYVVVDEVWRLVKRNFN
jgi:ATP-dependent DNA helicase